MLISKKAELETEGGLQISTTRTRHLLALHQGKLWEGLAHLPLFPYGKKQRGNNETATENKQTRSTALSRRRRGIPPAHPRARHPPRPAGRCSAAQRREAPGANPDAPGPPSRRSGESWPHPTAFLALRPDAGPGRRGAPELCPPGRGALAAGPASGEAPAQAGRASRRSGPSRRPGTRRGEARRSEAKQAPAMAGQESPGPAAATAPSRPPPPAPGLSPGRGPPQLQPRRATHARHRTMEHEPPSSPRPAQPGRGKLPARLPSAHMRTAKLPAPGGRAPRLLGAGCLASARALSVRGVEVRHGVVVSGASAPHGEPRREGRGWLNTGVLTTAPEYGGGWREVGAGSSRCASGRGCTQGLSGEGPASVLVLKGFWRPIPRQLSGAWLKGASSPKNGVGISWWTWAAWPGKCARAWSRFIAWPGLLRESDRSLECCWTPKYCAKEYNSSLHRSWDTCRASLTPKNERWQQKHKHQ